MASSFAKSLLASIVAAVVAGTAVAQDSKFQEAVKLLRLGQRAEAEKAFQEVLSKDPSNAEALQLYQSISQDEWYMLMTEKGEIQKIAASILERAKLEKSKLSRDAAAIETLVATACAEDSSEDARREAVLKLIASHGEFAVPALAARLGNPDDDKAQVRAISTLQQMGSRCVLPLIELLKSGNSSTRQNAAAALSHIADGRAAPAMARLLQSDDEEKVREIGRRFLAKHKISGKASDLYVAQARGYLKSGVTASLFSDVVWTLTDDKLQAKDVPAMVYAAELAKGAANDAVMADPASNDAKSLVAQANLAEAGVIEASIAQGDAEAKALEAMVPEFKLTALAAGPAVLRSALDEGVKQGLPAVAVGAIEALAAVEERDQLAASSLVAALDSTDKRVRYAAATALVKASGGVSVPGSDKVVDALAQAVTEESVRMISVIGSSAEMHTAAQQASARRGNATFVSASARDGMRGLLDMPGVDVVVIQENLPDRNPEDVIGNIKKDPRMTNVKIVIVAKDVEAAKTRFGESVHGVVAAPLTGENLIAAVNTALENVPIEPRNARAEVFAKGASESLLAMATAKAGIAPALPSLAAQLNRADAISVPAAKALGLSGSPAQLDALVAALNGTGSVDLKVAAAAAIGMILGRADSCPTAVVEALMAVLGGGGELSVRTAVAGALGKAKLDDASKAKLLNSLKKVGGPAAQG